MKELEEQTTAKIPRLFPILHNIKDFVVKNHPEYHPDTRNYTDYWEDEERKCIEGKWGLDKNTETGEGGYRYCPPQLYYYVNYCVIEDEDETNNSSEVIIPILRDIEWAFFTNYLICRGFSGFTEDPEYTSAILIKKLENGVDLNPKEKKKLAALKWVRKENGDYKKYIEPRDYLYNTHDKILGVPIYENDAKSMFWLGSRGLGKALKPSEVVLTEKGWVAIKDIKINDKVYGSDGKLTNVVNKTNVQKDLTFYKIIFNDGREIECCEDHNWKIWYKGDNRYTKNNWSVKTTKELLSIYKTKPRLSMGKEIIERTCFIPLTKAINYTAVSLPIDPYFLGIWLGDGSSHRPGITSIDKEIVECCYNIAKDHNCKVVINQNTNKTCPTYNITEGRGRYKPRVLYNKFKSLNLFHNKHIPDLYKYSSIEQRMELLKGLMDTDGTSSGNNNEFYSKSKVLATDVYNLALSLGLYCTIKTKKSILNGVDYGDSYRVKITTDQIIFKLPRKINNQKIIDSKKPFSSRYSKVGIKEIVPLPKSDGICIAVDNYDNTYITKNYIVTHNSYIMASLISHVFKFHGAVAFDDSYFSIKKGPEITVGAALSSKSADLLKKFKFMEEFQKENFGSWGENEAFIPGYFFQNVLGTLVTNNNKSPYRAEYLYKEAGVERVGGKGTKITHVSYESNAEAGVGGRNILSILEEVGLFQNLLQTWASNDFTLIRKNRFGTQLAGGTGGSMDKIVESRILFEDPETYNCLGFPDLWENRKKPIGFFVPAYYQDNSFRDINGNQDVEAAYEVEQYERAKLANADNSFALDGYMMGRPLVPSEIFLSGQSTVFPVALLRDQYNQVLIKDLYNIYSYKGELEWNKTKTGVTFKVDLANKLKPILSTNLDKYKGNLKGAIVCYEAPEENIPQPNQNNSLYKIVYDPIKDDGHGTSLASIIVYKGVSENNWAVGLQDDIVAEYLGRMDLVEDIHDLCVKLAMYYNGKIMVETNIPDFIRYCRREGYLSLLQAKPIDAISKIVKNPGKKYDVGIDMTSPALHDQSEQLIRQWLLTEWKTTEEGYVLKNLNKIKSIAILNQLMEYSRQGNYDHISSLKLLMLWLKQTKETPIKKSSDIAKESIDDFYKQTIFKKSLSSSNYHNY